MQICIQLGVKFRVNFTLIEHWTAGCISALLHFLLQVAATRHQLSKTASFCGSFCNCFIPSRCKNCCNFFKVSDIKICNIHQQQRLYLNTWITKYHGNDLLYIYPALSTFSSIVSFYRGSSHDHAPLVTNHPHTC